MSDQGIIDRALDSFRDWLGRRLPDCRDITPTIGESLDRKLGLWERLIMKLHLFTCDRCVRYLDQIGFLGRTFHDHHELIAEPDASDTVAFSAEAKDKLKQMLNASMLSAF